LKKSAKDEIIAGLCATGLCALANTVQKVLHNQDSLPPIIGLPFRSTSLYALIAARHLKTMYQEIADEVADSDHGSHILDLAAGLGYLEIEFASRDEHTTAVGLDSTPELVRMARTNALAAKSRHNIHFTVGTPSDLPFPGRYFDLVVSPNILGHWPTTSDVFDEVFHVLGPGREFWIYDYRPNVPKEVWTEAEMHLPVYLRVPFAVGPVNAAKSSPNQDELLKSAQESRFEVASVEDRTFTLFGLKMPVFTRITLRKPAAG
jgi:ubiquinone/menaquinone biosynthesis C-methylase UbiE